jgi:Mor family transcriptional regulator
VDDVLRRMREHSLVPDDVLDRIEQEVRAEYGGERSYIARVGELGQQIRGWRDERIRAEYGRGEHIPLLSRRWHLSERRIRQIVERKR